MGAPLFEIEGLAKRFDGDAALEGIDLTIKRGECLALLGPSGAGKTTLLRILNTLERPDSGRVGFEGTDLRQADNGRLLGIRRKMVLLAQGAPLFNTTVRENLAYPLKVRGMDKGEIEDKVSKALEAAGLTGYGDRKAWTLSGGERQRVALAMAGIFGPEVLLLDEPTANLDPINAEAVEEFIMRMKQKGVTVIISTHKQTEAAALADRIVVINHGRIEQVGPAREIFQEPATDFVRDFTRPKDLPDWSR